MNNKGFIGLTILVAVGVAAMVAGVIGTYITFDDKIKNLQIENSDLTSQIQGLQNRISSNILGSVFTPVQAQKFTLAGSGVSAAATTITLQTMQLPDGRDITMSMVGDIGYGTLEPGTSREESISFTGITQNSDDTATLTGVTRGRDFVSPYAASSTLEKAHAGGAIFILTNTSAFYGQRFAILDNTSTITGLWTFPSSSALWPRAAATSTLSGFNAAVFATKDYVDSVATSGAANADETTKGLVEVATSSELAAGTSVGGSGALLVPVGSAFNATSTSKRLVPVTQSNGKLSQGFLDLTIEWLFSDFRSNSSTLATTTFSVIPTLPSSTATTGNQTVRKADVDNHFVTLFWSQVPATSTAAGATLISVDKATSTITLNTTSSIIIHFVGSVSNASAGGICRFNLSIDGNNVVPDAADLVLVESSAANDFGNASFTFVSSSTLSNATHTVNLLSSANTGICSIRTSTFAIIQY